jgi:hypothetical protein
VELTAIAILASVPGTGLALTARAIPSSLFILTALDALDALDVPTALAVHNILATATAAFTLVALDVFDSIAAASPTRIRSNRRIKMVWLNSRCSGCAASRSAKTRNIKTSPPNLLPRITQQRK